MVENPSQGNDMKALMTLVVVLVSAGPAFAEWGLYANRNGKGFVLEQTFAFYEDCNRKARDLWRADPALAFGCSEYTATAYSRTQQLREQHQKAMEKYNRDRAAALERVENNRRLEKSAREDYDRAKRELEQGTGSRDSVLRAAEKLREVREDAPKVTVPR